MAASPFGTLILKCSWGAFAPHRVGPAKLPKPLQRTWTSRGVLPSDGDESRTPAIPTSMDAGIVEVVAIVS